MQTTKPTIWNRARRGFQDWLRLFSALRFRDFRLFWIGLTSQIIGQQMFQFTVGWLAFDLTGKPGTLALIHLVGFIPRLPLTLFGGVFADRWDQRRLILVAQGVSATAILTVAMLAVTENIEVWHLITAAFVLGVSQAIDEPSRTAFFPRLLPDRSHIPSAVPLISMAWSTTRIMAPSIGGFVIAAGGASMSFFVSAAGAATMVTLLRMVKTTQAAPTTRGNVLHNLVDGFKYVRRNEVFSKVITAAFVFATFTMGYSLMLPVFAVDILAVDSRGLGLLAASSGVGSFFALGTFNLLHKWFKPGTVVIFGLTMFCCTLIGFAFSSWFWLSLILLAGTGMAHIYFQTSANVILQTLVDEEYRGRVMALYGVLWSLLLLSAALLNFTAELIGPRLALTGGASIVLAYVWLFLIRSSALRNVSLETGDEQAEPPSTT
ncbi:MAG: MFS transporter [Chloroflexi bacterium]|nr:MFS transporter [Chloroflexota bacterium]